MIKHFCSFLLLAAAAFAQAVSSLTGTVSDPSGAAVGDATVEVINLDTNAKRAGTTAADGGYSFPQLAPGRYSLTVKARGFPRVRLMICN